MNDTVTFSALTPYIYYDDASGMSQWLARAFGFVETGRHLGEDGKARNIEMTAGPLELWLDGYPGYRHRGEPPTWIGLWVDDVDAMYRRVTRAGLSAERPENKPYGVRMLSVRDPEGVTWGFMKRLEPGSTE
jgi:uncharacterized glyoxalase superfamily protein PhnB